MTFSVWVLGRTVLNVLGDHHERMVQQGLAEAGDFLEFSLAARVITVVCAAVLIQFTWRALGTRLWSAAAVLMWGALALDFVAAPFAARALSPGWASLTGHVAALFFCLLLCFGSVAMGVRAIRQTRLEHGVASA